MKFLFLSLSALLLVGAGCAQSISTSYSSDPSQIEAVEEESAQTAYVMSNNFLLFSAPSDWSVVQRDAGNASSIQIDAPTGILVISIQRAQTFEGDALVYESWLSENFDVAPTSTTTVAEYSFDVFEVSTSDDEKRRVLTAEISSQDTDSFVKITLPMDADPDLSAVVDSFVFNPSEEAREDAQIMR